MKNIKLKQFSLEIKSFKFEDNNLFSETNLLIYSPGIYLLSGNNGIGKTTLLKIIAGYFIDFDGEIFINEDKINDFESYRENYISYVDQEVLIFDDYNVLDNILMPYEKKDVQKAKRILDLLKLSNLEKQNVSLLSQGEKQRLVLARILYDLKPILLLDEITNSLDAENVNIIINALNELKKSHIIILVTHKGFELDKIEHNRLIIKDKKIILDQVYSYKNDINVNVKKVNLFNDFKDAFKRHKLSKAIFSFVIILFTSLFLIYANFALSFKDSYSDLANKKVITLTNYIDSAPLIIMKDNDNFKFDDNSTFKFNEMVYSLDIDHTKPGSLISGYCVLDNNNFSDYNINLYEYEGNQLGRYPTHEDEILISSYCFDYLYKAIKNEYKIEDFNTIMSLILNNQFMDTSYIISGIYQANLITNDFNIRISNQDKANYSTMQRASYAFMIETVFGYNNLLNSNYIGVKATSNNKAIAIQNMQYIHLDISTDIYFDMINIDKNGKNPLSKYVYVAMYKFISTSFLIGLAIISIIFPLAYYQMFKNEILLLRYASYSRKRLLKAHIISALLLISISLILGMLFGIIYCEILDFTLSSSIIASSAKYILFDKNILIYSFVFLCLSYINIFLTFFKVMIPKDISKNVLEIKRK